jgi:hypothetical protein
VHGLAVELRCDVPQLDSAINRAFGEFAVPQWPDGFVPVSGAIRPFEQAQVLRHLSSTAAPVSMASPVLELFQERERFWAIDECWGLCELNMLKGQWQSWILPSPAVDPVTIVERAVQWPMAQLLRAKGLTMIPAASVARGDFAMLIIAPFGIEPELLALIRAGFKIIGQQWTALREEDGRIAMLHLPGIVQRSAPPRLRTSAFGDLDSSCARVDLAGEHCGTIQNHAFADGVVIVEPGRRPTPSIRPVLRGAALPALRSAWPIVELHPQRRHSTMPARLAQHCSVFTAHLSRSGEDFLTTISTMVQLTRGKNPTAPLRCAAA